MQAVKIPMLIQSLPSTGRRRRQALSPILQKEIITFLLVAVYGGLSGRVFVTQKHSFLASGMMPSCLPSGLIRYCSLCLEKYDCKHGDNRGNQEAHLKSCDYGFAEIAANQRRKKEPTLTPYRICVSAINRLSPGSYSCPTRKILSA